MISSSTLLCEHEHIIAARGDEDEESNVDPLNDFKLFIRLFGGSSHHG